MTSFCFLLLIFFLLINIPISYSCTSIVFGRLSTMDQSTYTASTSDCYNCDFRLAKVSSRTYPASATRPIFLCRSDYPHVVDSSRSSTWHPSNLEGTTQQRQTWVENSKPIGYIPQVNHTNTLFESGSGYALLNEHGVSIGESTCPARFVSKPKSRGGHALLDVSELSRIGLERGNTAKQVIQIMGDLAMKYGYYGAEWDLPSKFEEAGESLMVGDPNEAWVFHILPDDTGRSAIWVAQKVPDTDITVVANTFIIRNIDPNDKINFMYSHNLFQIAERYGFWKKGNKLDFSKTYGKKRIPSRSSYSVLRAWRVFTLVNPNLLGKLNPFANDYLDGYPFSVTPAKKLTRNEMFQIFRDHYEGSRFDLTKGDAAGPYGDPDRYDSESVGNMSFKRAIQGEFGRAISLFRTSYTTLCRSKASLPKEVGSMMYYSQQQPSSSVFVPLYISMKEIPKVFRRGSLFGHSSESMFWAVTSISNWVHRYYNHAVSDLRELQKSIEDYDVDEIDKKAAELYSKGRSEDAMNIMHNFSHEIANNAFMKYIEAFPKFIGKFHDGVVRTNMNGDRVNLQRMFYPEWWLHEVGYFAARETGGSYGISFEPDVYHVRHDKQMKLMKNFDGYIWSNISFISGMILGGLIVLGIVHSVTNVLKGANANGYMEIK